MVTGMNDPVEYGKTGKGFWKVLLTLFLLGLLTGCGAGAENNISGRAGAPDAAGGSDLSDGSLPAESAESGNENETAFPGSYTVPEGWVLAEQYSTEDKLFYVEEGHENDELPDNISIETGTNRYGEDEHEQFRDAIFLQLMAQLQGVDAQLTGDGTYTEQGYIVYIFTISEANVVTKQYYIVGDRQYCLIHLTSFTGSGNADNAAREMADSFSFEGTEESGDTGAVTGQTASGTGVTGGAAGQKPSPSDMEKGASVTAQQEGGLPDAYKEILDSVYNVLLRMENDAVKETELVGLGVQEVRIGRTEEEILACVGYMLYDADGNGVQELIIAEAGEGLWDNRILNMYTLQEEKPVVVIDGWARNRYYILNDGRIYNEGSGGAAYTIFGTYRIGADGLSLEPIDYYFSDYPDDAAYAAGETAWFHNTTGEYDVKKSEIMEWENDEVPWKMQEEFEAQVMPLELTFFSEYL